MEFGSLMKKVRKYNVMLGIYEFLPVKDRPEKPSQKEVDAYYIRYLESTTECLALERDQEIARGKKLNIFISVVFLYLNTGKGLNWIVKNSNEIYQFLIKDDEYNQLWINAVKEIYK
jgi:hypothetical protein